MLDYVDKKGLERSVLTYVDVAAQKSAKYILVVDESYGKALFSVDAVDVHEREIIGYRFATKGEKQSKIITKFSPSLHWRMISNDVAYVQTTRQVIEHEASETKNIRAFRDEVLKKEGLDTPGGEIPEVAGTGVYL